MINATTTPGVQYEHSDARAPVVSAMRTDVAGFAGLAVRGPIGVPVPVESWKQFVAHFGGLSNVGFLGYAVRAFFENGGQRCWVVRVASASARASDAIVSSPVAPVFRIVASSEGSWGDRLRVTIRERRGAQTRSEAKADVASGLVVGDVSGFERATAVRIRQDGRPAVIRVVEDVETAQSRLVFRHRDPALRLRYNDAILPLDASRPAWVESIDYGIEVHEDGRRVARFDRLSWVRESERYAARVLGPAGFAHREGREPYPDPHEASDGSTRPPAPIAIEAVHSGAFDPESASRMLEHPAGHPAVERSFSLQGGDDGYVDLTADDYLGATTGVGDAGSRRPGGLAALERVPEVAMLAIPDLHAQPKRPAPRRVSEVEIDPCRPSEETLVAIPFRESSRDLPPELSLEAIERVQAAMVEQCERLRDRVAILDAPARTALEPESGAAGVRTWRRRFDSSYAALYYPWIRVIDPASQRAEVRDLPPSGHVAGQIAAVDLDRGTHEAPANRVLSWASDSTADVDDTLHGILNPLGINVIRPVPGRGIRILGARTLSSDAQRRFLNVRRLLILVRKAIDVSTQWAAFEPNDTMTRTKLTLSLTSFLLVLWQRGALAGDEPAAAFRVRCDAENNPARERDNGRMLAEVRLAPVQPYEFVVVRVGRLENELGIYEVDEDGGAA